MQVLMGQTAETEATHTHTPRFLEGDVSSSSATTFGSSSAHVTGGEHARTRWKISCCPHARESLLKNFEDGESKDRQTKTDMQHRNAS